MTAFILENLCLGCQRCIDACPNHAINMVAHLAVVNQNSCKECEACIEVCIQGAITFRTNNDGVSLLDDDLIKQELFSKRLNQLQEELNDLKARWPAHSVKPAMVKRLEELEELEEELLNLLFA